MNIPITLDVIVYYRCPNDGVISDHMCCTRCVEILGGEAKVE